ncbi:hypothetical protein ACFSKU_04960 [Pontibacter silvestris]|uniref:STAS/SEC14 domain-containing protein n=1 Tax=Pontibacter silvestris TaxID=2305183 RepID=A0ABW4WVJ8_9BACT|nr:hypothetical protein [Pontibacter silvestris]MCC9136886.1 hypothetical protein [Pontibacter silvestris]
MTEYHGSYLHIWVDDSINLMYSEWLRRPTKEEFKEGVKLLIKYLYEYSVEFWVMESNKLVGMPLNELRRVIRKVASVIVLCASLKKIARILINDISNILKFEETINEFKVIYHSSVEFEWFSSFKDAVDWIGRVRC